MTEASSQVLVFNPSVYLKREEVRVGKSQHTRQCYLGFFTSGTWKEGGNDCISIHRPERRTYRPQNAGLLEFQRLTIPSLFSLISWNFNLISRKTPNNLLWEMLTALFGECGASSFLYSEAPSQKVPQTPVVVRKDEAVRLSDNY